MRKLLYFFDWCVDVQIRDGPIHSTCQGNRFRLQQTVTDLSRPPHLCSSQNSFSRVWHFVSTENSQLTYFRGKITWRGKFIPFTKNIRNVMRKPSCIKPQKPPRADRHDLKSSCLLFDDGKQASLSAKILYNPNCYLLLSRIRMASFITLVASIHAKWI